MMMDDSWEQEPYRNDVDTSRLDMERAFTQKGDLYIEVSDRFAQATHRGDWTHADSYREQLLGIMRDMLATPSSFLRGRAFSFLRDVEKEYGKADDDGPMASFFSDCFGDVIAEHAHVTQSHPDPDHTLSAREALLFVLDEVEDGIRFSHIGPLVQIGNLYARIQDLKREMKTLPSAKLFEAVEDIRKEFQQLLGLRDALNSQGDQEE